MTVKTIVDDKTGITFRQYYGRFQNMKYDSKKDDYYITYNRERFYLSKMYGASDREYMDAGIIGTFQDGYSVYIMELKQNKKITDRKVYFDDVARIVFCPPGR